MQVIRETSMARCNSPPQTRLKNVQLHVGRKVNILACTNMPKECAAKCLAKAKSIRLFSLNTPEKLHNNFFVTRSHFSQNTHKGCILPSWYQGNCTSVLEYEPSVGYKVNI